MNPEQAADGPERAGPATRWGRDDKTPGTGTSPADLIPALGTSGSEWSWRSLAARTARA